MRRHLRQDVPALTGGERPSETQPAETPSRSLRRLALDALGIALSSAASGLVYGLAARGAGFSVVDVVAMSVLVLAGAAQFAAVGFVAQGVPWPAIVVLTALLNARHLLYSAALAPWLVGRARPMRAAMAHVLTDETFALSLAHFERVGRGDVTGYWLAGAFVTLPWIVATIAGAIGGAAVPDPATWGLDVVFPAAMAGIGVLLVRRRADVVAALVGATVAIATGLLTQPAVGIVAGGLVGPLVALALHADERALAS